MKLEFLDMTILELETILISLKQPKFRAKQIFQWLHKGVQIQEMTNLPQNLRDQLDQIGETGGVQILEKHQSKIDKTAKYLFLLNNKNNSNNNKNLKNNKILENNNNLENNNLEKNKNNNIVEGVLMHHDYGKTLCISSQVGCAMGCTFCASTIGGLVRNLTAGEMLGQVIAIEKENAHLVEKNQERFLRNIVIMGSGEPLDNYDNTIKFLKLVNDPNGVNISLRNISLSTCGIIEKIPQLAKDAPGVTLSISLHAATDERRREIMPIAKSTSIFALVSAAKEFINITGRRIVFEYALISGVNDSEADARELAKLLYNMQCIVNLIPINPIKENSLLAPKAGTATKFLEMLAQNGQEATIRRELGKDVNGACGQLRNSYFEEKIG